MRTSGKAKLMKAVGMKVPKKGSVELTTKKKIKVPTGAYPAMQAQVVCRAFEHVKKNLGYDDVRLVDSAQWSAGWIILMCNKEQDLYFGLQYDNKPELITDDITKEQFYSAKGRGTHRSK